MFKDYYKILSVSTSATSDEIRYAYRKLCKQWHPDINADSNATAKMQDVNEAYLILKDPIKRQRYDVEYVRFKAYEQRMDSESSYKSRSNRSSSRQNDASSAYRPSYQRYRHYDYDIEDDFVKKDVEEARKKAEDYINELIDSIKDSSEKAVKGAFAGCFPYIIFGLIGTIIALLILSSY